MNMRVEPSDAGEGKTAVPAALSAAKWQEEIRAAEKATEKWREQATKIVRRYLDKRDAEQEQENRMNLFTTNTNILMSTLYAQFPKPMVTREFEDQDDDVARVAANILERMLTIRKGDDFDIAMRYVVQDRLVPGLGQVWFRYEPTIVKQQIEAAEEYTDATGQVIPAQPAMEFDRIVDEHVCCDYIHWQDFFWSPCRVWEECRWIAKRVRMTKVDVIGRFGQVIADQLTYKKGSKDPSGSMLDEHDPVKYAEIFELWHKRSKCVYWFSMDSDVILDKQPAMFDLKNFWPTPKPLAALNSTSEFIPRPDFLLVQDQYNELDEINSRIIEIEKAIRVVGIYDSTNNEVASVFRGRNATMIGSTSFQQFAATGGFKGSVDWMPIEEMANTVQKLREYRAELMAQIYELTGISDIMRGQTKATETLGAQQLKAQFGGVRLQMNQLEIGEFVESALEIKAEIIRTKFLPETILARSNIQRSLDVKLVPQAMQLLQDKLWFCRVEIHADTMAVPEFNAERDARINYARVLAEILQQSAPIIEKDPMAGAYILKVMQWVAGGFRVGRGVESILDEAINAINTAAMQPKQPDPKETAQTQNFQAQARRNSAEAEGQEIENLLVASSAAEQLHMGTMPPNPLEKPAPTEGDSKPPTLN